MPHDHHFHSKSSTTSNPNILNVTHDHKTPILEGNETRTRWVVWLTLATMVVELLVGWWTNSMALTADGWHMASHAGALGLTLFGYSFARKYDSDPRFSFGTGKVFALTGFASAIALFVAGILVSVESVHHMLEPETVAFTTAMWVAIVGLVINLISAWILSKDDLAEQAHGHSHGHHGHAHAHHDHGHAHGQDHNLRGAYLHVIADALTSVLAIVALFLGQQFENLWFFDPLMGVVGGVIIIRWALQLGKETGWILLSAMPNQELETQIRHHFDHLDGIEIVDLHLWDMGLGRHCCILSVLSDNPQPCEVYKKSLCESVPLAHCTIEVLSHDEQTCNHPEHTHENLVSVHSEHSNHDHDHKHAHDH